MKKKLAFLLTLFVAHNAMSMQHAYSQTFFNAVHDNRYLLGAMTTIFMVWRSLPWLAQKFSKDLVTNQLGFNPLTNQKIVSPNENRIPLLCAQGWPGIPGPSNNAWIQCDRNKKGLDHEDIFILDCHTQDSLNLHSKNPLNVILGIRTINIGDEQDALAILYTLVQCYKAGHKKVYGFGQSRGGSSWITALDMLQNPTDFVSIWKQLEIIDTRGNLDLKKIYELRTMIENGHLFLGNPLIDIDYPLEGKKPFLKFFSKLYLTTLLTFFTSYNPFRYQPHEILKKVIPQNDNLKVSISFAKKDVMIGDRYNNNLISLSQKHPNLVAYQDNDNYHHNDLTGTFHFIRTTLNQKKTSN